jgi:hypothetical protein
MTINFTTVEILYRRDDEVFRPVRERLQRKYSIPVIHRTQTWFKSRKKDIIHSHFEDVNVKYEFKGIQRKRKSNGRRMSVAMKFGSSVIIVTDQITKRK